MPLWDQGRSPQLAERSRRSCDFHRTPTRQGLPLCLSITTLVHGNDYASAGREKNIRWLDSELKKKFEIKTVIVGHSEKDAAEANILNQIIRATENGCELEADPRHAEFIIEELGLQNAKGVATPGEDNGHDEKGENGAELDQWMTQRFRSLTARANYLAADRPDIRFAVKEMCSDMSCPTNASWNKLKRLGKFLVGKARLVWKFGWESRCQEADGYSDSNWTGRKESRKSTSGEAVMLGTHVIRTWSKTQTTIALSSAEAELFGGVKTACETLGVASLLRDLGQDVSFRMHMDASAALGIAQRKGVGKVRHLSTGTLWLQEQDLKEILKVVKINGNHNIADIFTKNLSQLVMEKHLHFMGLEYRGGRAQAAAQLHSLSNQRSELRHKEGIEKMSPNNDSCRTVAEDRWESNGLWRNRIRWHDESRRQMFTPLNTAGGPRMACEVGSVRTTIGQYSNSGMFVKVDHWREVDKPNRQLKTGWCGFTVFTDKPLPEQVVNQLKAAARKRTSR